MKNLVSIIMPTYNCANYIEESIISVIKQTYTNWELIIIDDCSTDNTKEVVNDYLIRDSRIKYIRLDVNSGAAIARNKGMEQAKGKYIAFLDSDDLWMKDKLEKQIKFMESNGYAFTCTTYAQIDEDGKQNGVLIRAKKKVDYNGVLLSCPIGNSSVIYDVDMLGKFEVPNIRKRNDDALWLQILKKEKYAYGLDEVLMEYRVRSNSISSNKFDLIKYHWYLYREIEQLSVFRSAWHILCWVVIKLLRIK
ncbi:MAG TPA: glycosyltransferase family 2 protein [Defluviitoga tunisiensis]|nr:glycosyltransferase family 2 protein [Defluviitoga tunisiensis]